MLGQKPTKQKGKIMKKSLIAVLVAVSMLTGVASAAVDSVKPAKTVKVKKAHKKHTKAVKVVKDTAAKK